MPILTLILFVVSYALLAGAGALVLRDAGLLDPTSAWLGGGVIFAVLSQLHLLFARSGDRKRTDNGLAQLDRRVNGLEATNESLEAALEGMASAVETRLEDREKQIIAEVRVLEGLVRALEGQVPPRTEVTASSTALAVQPQEPHEDPGFIEIVREALENNRVDVYLQPIVSLPQRKLRFYEAFSRLRDPAGQIIMPRDYLRVAEPAGLMAVIDNLLLFRCVQVVRQLTKRSPGTAIFCNISGHSLRDATFFPQFVDYMDANADLAGQLVFEFGQADLQACSSQEESSLERLAARGFAFSMDKVQTLDVDFHALGRFNFRFVKVDAKTLISGLEHAGAPVHGSDLKAFARRHGIDLIVEKIEDERAVVDVLDFDVDFGQGFLFGAPAPVEQVLRSQPGRLDALPPSLPSPQQARVR